jgi:hypothetical protein
MTRCRAPERPVALCWLRTAPMHSHVLFSFVFFQFPCKAKGLLYSSSIPSLPCDSSFLCPAGIDEMRQRNGRNGIACSIGNPPVSVECAWAWRYGTTTSFLPATVRTSVPNMASEFLDTPFRFQYNGKRCGWLHSILHRRRSDVRRETILYETHSWSVLRVVRVRLPLGAKWLSYLLPPHFLARSLPSQLK